MRSSITTWSCETPPTEVKLPIATSLLPSGVMSIFCSDVAPPWCVPLNASDWNGS